MNSSTSRLRLRTLNDTGNERHASWLELFFDLVFVLAISRLAHLLNESMTPLGFLQYAALFIPIWWAWVGYSFYADRFESEDAPYRVLMFAGMLAVTGMALNIHGAFRGDGDDFAIAYVLMRGVLILLYARAWVHVPEARELCGRYVVGFTVGAALWLASAWVPPPARFGLWSGGLLVEMATPILSGSAVRRTPFDVSHIPERFGLFTIIVLGEAILAVGNGVAETQWRWRSAIVAGVGFAIAALLWWFYFEFVETHAVRREWRHGQLYIYGHLPIVLGIVTTGVGMEHAILEAGSQRLPPATGWALGSGVALFLAFTALIRLASGSTSLLGIRLGAAGVLAALAAASYAFVAALPLVLLILGILLGLLALEAFARRLAPGSRGTEPEGT